MAQPIDREQITCSSTVRGAAISPPEYVFAAGRTIRCESWTWFLPAVRRSFVRLARKKCVETDSNTVCYVGDTGIGLGKGMLRPVMPCSLTGLDCKEYNIIGLGCKEAGSSQVQYLFGGQGIDD